MYVGVKAWKACLLIPSQKCPIILHHFQGQRRSSGYRNIFCTPLLFCYQTWTFVGRMCVHQQSRVTVAPDSLVHWRESVFGAKVNMSPSLHQHSDGLTSTGFTLHSKGQGCFCQKNKYITHLFLKTTASDQDQWNVPFNGAEHRHF